MNITFKQLEAFYSSAVLRSFSAAATRLHTTQSAISKRVAELEDALGLLLFRRMTRGLELTEAGRRLMPLAKQSRQLLQRIDAEITTDQEIRGSFRVGVTELIALTWLTSFMRRIQASYPGVIVEPRIDRGLTLLDALEEGKVDLIIMPGTYWGPQYVTVKVGETEDHWVASPSLKLPRRPLKPHEFAQYPVLEMAASGSKHKFYAPWRAKHGFKFDRVLSTNSTSAIRELAIGGFGIGQLAVDFVRPDVEAGLLRIVKSDPMPPPMVYSAVYRQDDSSRALECIASLAVECCDFRRRADVGQGAKQGRKARRTTAGR